MKKILFQQHCTDALRIALLSLVVVVLYGSALSTASAQVSVIVNKGNAVASMSMSDLRAIFSGETTKFAGGANITIVTYKSDNPTRKKFYDALGKKYAECQASILKRMMNDGLKPPATFETDDDVAAFVAKTPGAIGFVATASVGAAKAITVDGKKQID